MFLSDEDTTKPAGGATSVDDATADGMTAHTDDVADTMVHTVDEEEKTHGEEETVA